MARAAAFCRMLVILTSHPVQYQAPLWRALAAEHADFEVWFLTDQGLRHTEDKDFGKSFAWDVDLLSGYPHRFVELRGPWDMRRFNGIRPAKPFGEMLREAGATAVWVEGWRFKAFWDAVHAAKKAELPVFLRGETTDKIPERGGAAGLLRRFLLHRLFAKVDRFLAIGQASRRFYLKHGVPASKLMDAPYGVDNAFFRAEAERLRGVEEGSVPSSDQIAIRCGWGIPENARVVLFCGKFVPKKRPMDLVKAAEKLAEKGSGAGPIHLLFAGSGELGGELRSACRVVHDAEGTVAHISDPQRAGKPAASFTGFLNQSQIPRAYAVADLLVLPSEAWETWGLVVNEATASGVPTVVSDQCGCAEDFAAANPFTRVFPAADAGALADAMESSLGCPRPPWREVARHAGAFDPEITTTAVARLLAGRTCPGGAL